SGVEQLREQLAKSYDVRSISLTDSAQPARDVSTIVLIGSPDSLSAAATQRLQAFFRRGGSALVLTSAMTLAQRMPVASPHPVAWNAVLKPFGVSVRSDMVYDLLANEVVPVRATAGTQGLERYPYFVRAQSTGQSVVDA